MRVNDAIDIRAMEIEPSMKTVCGVWHAVAVNDVKILIDVHQIALAYFFQPEAELLGVEGAVRSSASTDLTGQR
ncbi:hypothetical protein GCM10007901_24710 [Dyella acidisoli]|uniref:Uncharacterized protein n=1 Tax=Dyella acidisoli TaxID=1867834 RepID=A0ABQ5XP65_9GAMM|nr:hypothetical protein GCM10007901_24710 [Dyella acidisoli]